MKQKTKISTKLSKKDIFNENSKNMCILELLTNFTKEYIEEKEAANLSKKTISNIKIILERFYDYIADELAENESLAINDINKYFLNNYLNELTNKKIGKSTQKLHLTLLKGFLSYIADSDVKEYDSLKINISKLNGLKIKTEQKERESFNQNEQKLLLDYVAKLDAKKNYLSQRNALLIKILLYAGLRISEVVEIKWSDVIEYDDDTHGLIYTILIKGKGNKERYAYIAYDKINNNLEKLGKRDSNPNDYLFVSTQGNQCNRITMYEVVKQILANAGIFKTGLHIFRHTFARNLVTKNINLSTIKDLLGHSNITVTAQFYAKSDEHAKRSALFKK